MRKLRLAVASEAILDDFRESLIELLGLGLDAQVLDMNVKSNWRTEEDLVANCVEKVLNGSVDFVVLASRTGNGLQMIANKHEHIRAAPIPRVEYVEGAAALNPNMCEVDARFHDPRGAYDLLVEFFRVRERPGR